MRFLMKYDIIMYFPMIHSSYIHKYFNLNKRLNEHCKCLFLVNNGQFGLTSEQYELFSPNTDNTLHVSHEEYLSFLEKTDFRLLVTATACRPTIKNRTWDDIDIARSKNAKVGIIFELLEMLKCYRDYTFLPSRHFSKIREVFNYTNFEYTNCFLWDNIENCLPYHLTEEEFCKKYGLKNGFYIWAPDNVSFQRGNAIDVYKGVCDLDNIIIKLHPNEIRRWGAHKVCGKWSYELFTDKKLPILDPIDTHWAYKYMGCLIAYQSTVGMELFIYKKPVLYIDLIKNRLCNYCFWKYYSWAGVDCSLEELKNFMDTKQYIVDDSAYKRQADIYTEYPDKLGVDVFVQTLLEILK